MPALENITTSIVPWLTVRESRNAVEFYKKAFGATEVYRLDHDVEIVSRLSVEGAEFWLSGEAGGNENTQTPEHPPVRMIITVSDPDTFFNTAIAAGATEIFPVGEEHGWRLGKLSDPYGHTWEIGRTI